MASRYQVGKPTPVDDDEIDLWNAGPPRRAAVVPPADSDSTDDSSDAESEDSAARRARIADAKLKDHNDAVISREALQKAPDLAPLPSVDAVFTAVAGPPAFLDPEATRQLPALAHQGSTRSGAEAGYPDASNREGTWDISRMAPKLKGDEDQPGGGAGVISAKAKRYKAADGEAVEVTAAQVAMLGGNAVGRKDKGKGTRAMSVEEFLEKGVGGAQLPRKRQDRKEKEKEKSGKGQRTHSHWKSEAEMALRQQFD